MNTRKIKGLPFLILIIMMVVFALSACTVGNGTGDTSGGDSGNNGTGGSASAEDGYLMQSGSLVYIVSPADNMVLPPLLARAVFDVTDNSARPAADTDEKEAHEIILGNCTRPLSVTANRMLERLLEDLDGLSAAYVIYSSGSSVAIAYNCEEALEVACEEFVSDYLDGEDKVTVKKGTLAKESFSLYEYYDREDEELRESAWASLEKYVNGEGFDGAATVAAFKKLYSMYSDSAYLWLANLYDPVTGGFYYSNSARDTITFAPDLESTRQALDFIRYSGMSYSLVSDLPKDMQASMVKFVRNLYDPETGYYIHPQWKDMEGTDERLGRDVTNANGILGALGASISAASAPIPSALKLTASLGKAESVMAVSKVVAVATPAHLASEAAFLEYLNSQNWNDSYTSGNRIAAQSYLINQNGLMEVCLDFFDKLQNPETGMWSPDRDDNAVNGFLKISAIYADYAPKYKRSLNYASEAADTCIHVLLSETPPSTVCWVYNVWYSLGNIISLLNSTGLSADKALAADIQSRLRESAPLYIEVAADKYLPFLKSDGSFSFTPKASSHESQGMPVCVSNMNEGDVNATYISIISITGRIFTALGYKKAEVPIFTKNDLKVFVSTVSSLGEIIKTNSEFGGTLRFNGLTMAGMIYSSDQIELDAQPEEVADEGYGYAYVTDESGNGVLAYGKENVSVGFEPRISFRIIEDKGTRYVFETRLKFLGGEMDNNSWHTRISMYGGGGRFWYLLLYTLKDGSLALGSRSDPLAKLNRDEWYTIRCEYYADSAEKASDRVCQIYVNGEYVGDGGTAGAAGKDSQFYRTMLEFSAAAYGVSYMLDDITNTRDEVAYVEPAPPDYNDAKGEYYTNHKVRGGRFDYDVEDYILPTASSNGTAVLEVSDGSLVFRKNTENPKDGEDSILFSKAFGDAFWNYSSRATVVEFDLRYENITAATPMKLRFGDSANDIVVSRSGDSLNLSHKFAGENTVIPLGTTSGEWFNLRLEQYWYRKDAEGNVYTMVKVFVNGEFIGEYKTNYNSATYNFYIYLLNAEKNASLCIDNLIMAHLDMPFVSGEGSVNPDENPGASDEEYIPSGEILSVKGGADGIVVLMHDDGSLSSARLLDTLYEKYSLKGDVALVLSNVYDSYSASVNVEAVNFWKTLINRERWNITNHSYTHTFWGENTEALEKEIVTSGEILRELFPTRRVLTFAYPGFSSAVAEKGKEEVYKQAYELVKEHYIAARDYEDGVNGLSGLDYYDLGSHSIGESWYSTAMNDIDLALEGKLAVIFMHKVVETAEKITDTSDTTLAAMEDITSKLAGYVEDGRIWNAYLEEAALYLRERENATLTVSGDAASLTLTLTDTLDDAVYNYPLTVRVEVPASWSYVKLTQGSRSAYAEVREVGGKWVVDVDVIPDGGAATLIPITKQDVPPTTEKEEEKEQLLPEPEFNPGDAVGDYFGNPENKGLRVDYDAHVTTVPEDTDAKNLLSVVDGALLFDDGAQENSAKYIRYRSALPTGYASYESLVTVFEMDFSLKQTFYNYPIQIKLGNVTYTVYYSKDYDSSYGTGNRLCMQATVTNSDGTSSVVMVPLGASLGQWSTLRLEHYYAADDGAGGKLSVLKVFVNNTYVFELRGATSSASDSAIIYMTRGERNSTSDADLYIDNVFLGHFDLPYVQQEADAGEDNPDGGEGGTTTDPENPEGGEGGTTTDPDAPDAGDALGEFYRDPSCVGERFDYDAAEPVMPTEASSNGSTTLTVKDGSLVFAKNTENPVAKEDYISFQSPFASDFWGYSSKMTAVELDLNYSGISVATPMKLRFGKDIAVSRSGDSLTLSYSYLGTAYSVPLEVKSGEWFNIRLEQYWYLKDEAGNACTVIKVYVNGAYKGEIYTNYDSATYKFYVFIFASEANAALMIDNVLVSNLERAYSKTELTDPENPEDGEGGEGGTTTDPENPEGGEGGTTTDPETPVTDDAKGEYYLSDEKGSRWDYDVITSLDGSNKTYTGTVGAYSIEDGSLKFDDGEAENAEMGMKYWRSYPSEYNVTILEFDFKLTQSYGTCPIQIKLGGVTYSIYYSKTTEESPGTYALAMKVDGADKALGTPINQWSTVRFEHWYSEGVLKVFVNNEFKFDIASSAGSQDSPRISLTANERKTGSNADLYIDNVFVGHFEKEFVSGDPKAVTEE